MRRAVIVIGCVAGGCVSLGDATPTCPSEVQAAATMVSNTVVGPTNGTSANVPIQATRAGDLVVVVVTEQGGEEYATIKLAGRDLAPWMSSGANECAQHGQISIARDVDAGATAVTVKVSRAITFSVSVLEFSGVTASLADPFSFDHQTASAATATAPAVDGCPGQVVVSTLMTCGELYALVPSSPFIGLDVLNGADTAYLIPSASGSFGAEWGYSGGSWSAMTIGFAQKSP